MTDPAASHASPLHEKQPENQNNTSHSGGAGGEPETFERAAREAMESLGSALAGLLAVLPGPMDRAVDVERSLDLDKKLAWQVFRLARSQTPAEVGRVPAARSVRRLLTAAKRRRVPTELIEKVREAFEGFEAFASAHAGDREALASMVRGISPETDEEEEIRVRRSLYRGNAQVWGLRMRQFVRSSIFLPPSDAPGAVRGEFVLSAHIGLEQIRADSHAAIVSWARPSGAKRADGTTRLEPSFTLHEQFCSRPLPRVVQRPSVGTGVETELVLTAVGRPGATTLYTSQTIADVRPSELARFEVNNIFCIPVENVVFDVYVPAGWSEPRSARAAYYGRRYHPEHVFERRDADLLPQRGTLVRLGEFCGDMPEVPGAPRHAEAVARMLEITGHAGATFDVYRSETKFPALHTLLALGIDRVAGGIK